MKDPGKITEKQCKALYNLLQRLYLLKDDEGKDCFSHREQTIIATVRRWVKEVAQDMSFDID